MPLDITCQHCGKSFRIADEVAGKHFRCVGCKSVLKAPELPARRQRDPAPGTRTAEPPPRRHESPQPDERPRRLANSADRTRNRPSSQPKREIEDYDESTDPFGYDEDGQASRRDLPPRQNRTQRQVKARAPNLRCSNPGASEEYHTICNEIAIFWIGLAVIIGGFAGLLHTVFFDGAGDIERHQTLIMGMASIAANAFVVGLITFTHSRIWLYVLFLICIANLVGSLILVLAMGKLFLVFTIAFCLMFTRIQKALAVYPR